MSQKLLSSLELDIQKYQDSVKKAESLARLNVNRDFWEVVLNGYLKEEAVRLVHLKAAPDQQDSTSQSAIVAQLDAIGRLHHYFERLFKEAEVARSSLSDAEDTREQLLAEDA